MSAPVLYNYVISQLSKSAGWKTENFAPEKKTANVLVVDGLSLVSVLYPPSLDWVLPSWKELHNRVKMFVHRLTERGFTLVVFFSVQREDETIEERKPGLLERYHWLTKVMRDIQSAQALPEDNFYFTPVRTITSAVCRAFQSCPNVNVIVTPLETVKAITTYCNMHKATIHAVVGTDLSEALIYPTPALISLHPAVFDWQSLWSGRQVSVHRVKRFHVYQSLVPAACLPVFASLVGNPIFSRDNLKGFYKSSLPHDVFDAAKGFIQECIKNITGRATPDEFAKRLYAKLEHPSLDYEQFLRLFRRSCNAYALPPGESPVPIIPETDVDTVYQQSFYFFEPLMEATNMPSVLLLRAIRMRSLHLKFGAMTFAEVYVNPQGTIATDYLTVPLAETSTDQASKMPILQRWQFFETLSGVDLTPVMKFDAKMQLQSPEEAWFYLTVMTMARLEGREVFRRKQELKRLLAQFVSLPEIHTLTDLPEGTVSLESVTLAHLFHNTIVHLSRLNKSCGSPFPTYTEWQLFDGSVYALADSVLFAHPAFKKHEQRYNQILHTIESNLPSNALIDEPGVTALQPLFRLGRASQQQRQQYRGGQQGQQSGYGGGQGQQKPGPSLTHLPTWFHRQGRGQGRWGQNSGQGQGFQQGAGNNNNNIPQQGGSAGVTQMIAAAAAAANIPMHTVMVPQGGGGGAPQLSAAPGGNTVVHIGGANANTGQVANTLLSLLSAPQQQRATESENSTGAMQKLLHGMLEGMKQQHGSSPDNQGTGQGASQGAGQGDNRRARRQNRQGGNEGQQQQNQQQAQPQQNKKPAQQQGQQNQQQPQKQKQQGQQQQQQQPQQQKQGQQNQPQQQGKQKQQGKQEQGKQANQQAQQNQQAKQPDQQKQNNNNNNNNNNNQNQPGQGKKKNKPKQENNNDNKQQNEKQQAQKENQKDKDVQKNQENQVAGESEEARRSRKPKPKWVRKESTGGALETTEGGASSAAAAQPAASDANEN